MSDKKAAEQQDPVTAKPVETKPVSKKVVDKDESAVNEVLGRDKTKKSGGGFFSLLAVLLAFVTLVLLWYVWQDSRSQLDTLNQQISDQEKSAVHQREDSRDIKTDISLLTKQQTGYQKQQQQLQEQLQAQQAMLEKWRSSNSDDWKLEEASYLLSLANEQLLVGKDKAIAEQLLQQVDRVLLGLNDRSVKPVRDALAQDLQKLGSLATVDVDGIFVRLNSLLQQVEQLPIINQEKLQFTGEKKQLEENASWAQHVEALIGQYIRIRNTEDPAQPLLAPKDDFFLHQNLMLSIRQGQMALLSHEPEVYKQSLQQAHQWIAQYFDNDAQAVKNTLSILDDLSKETIDQKVIDVSASQMALEQYKAMRQKTANRFYSNDNQQKKNTAPDVNKKPVKNGASQ